MPPIQVAVILPQAGKQAWFLPMAITLLSPATPVSPM